jgi:hypothetical protein
MNIHLVISTNNNTVNAIPLLMDEFKDNRVPVILSSELAKNSKWTANLKYVLEKKGLHPIIYHFPDKEDKMNNLLNQFKDYNSIFFNISGGKKNQMLSLLSLYIERNNNADRLIYMDNEKGKSIVKVFSEGFKFKDEIEPEYLLDLEDISNLYGYTCTKTNEKIEDFIFTPEKQNLPIDTIRQINKYFLEDPDIAILLYQYFGSSSVECDENSSVKEQIIKYLTGALPKLGQLKEDLDNSLKQNWNNEVKKLNTIKNKYNDNPRNITKEDWNALWKIIKQFIDENGIYNNYWGQLKKKLYLHIIDYFNKNQKPIITDRDLAQRIINKCQKLSSKPIPQKEIIFDSDVPDLLDMNYRKGFFFEDMLAVRFYDLIKEKKPEMLPRFYKNINGYNLGYDNNGNAYITENNEPNVEFDFVYVTNFGIIYSFEAKSFDIKGETVKSKSYSTTSQGGVFSSNIILTPIQKKHIEDKKINKFIPQSIKDKINAIQKYNVKLWYFDEIEEQLEKIL